MFADPLQDIDQVVYGSMPWSREALALQLSIDPFEEQLDQRLAVRRPVVKLKASGMILALRRRRVPSVLQTVNRWIEGPRPFIDFGDLRVDEPEDAALCMSLIVHDERQKVLIYRLSGIDAASIGAEASSEVNTP